MSEPIGIDCTPLQNSVHVHHETQGEYEECPNLMQDGQKWTISIPRITEVYNKDWIEFQKKSFVFQKELSVEVQDTDSGTFCYRLLNETDLAKLRKFKYVHYGLVRIGLDPLIRINQNLPFIAAIVDNSVKNNFEKALLGGVRANLGLGPVSFTTWPNLQIDLDDKHIQDTLSLKIYTDNWSKNGFQPGRRVMRILVCVVARGINTGKVPVKDSKKITELAKNIGYSENLTIEELDPRELTWPTEWVVQPLATRHLPLSRKTIREINGKLVITNTRPSFSLESTRTSTSGRFEGLVNPRPYANVPIQVDEEQEKPNAYVPLHIRDVT